MRMAEATKYGLDYFVGHHYGEDPQRRAMYRQEIARLEQHQPGGRLYDLGCGVGGFLNELDPHRWERHGVDLSPYAIDAARRIGATVPDYERAFDYPDAHFDAIVLRGTLQHLYDPFRDLRQCIRLLAPGGVLAFLATPNTRSPYYLLFGTLPALDPERNWFLPSDTMLAGIVQNLGLHVVEIRYPYLGTPYARPVRDHLKFAAALLGRRSAFPFWRNMMELYAVKV